MADDLVARQLLGIGRLPKDNAPGLVEQYLAPSPNAPIIDTRLKETGIPTPSPENRGVPEVPPSMASKVADVAVGIPIEWGTNVGKAFTSGMQTASSGLTDIQKNLPASGVGKVGLGLLGAVASPITGTAKTFVTDPVTKLTGSPAIGERAEFLASSALPVSVGGRVVSKSLPKNRAIDAVVDAVGIDNIPDVVKRLKENPRLSLMDVSPAVRQMGQKLITTEGKHQNKFEKFVNERVHTAKGTVEGIYNDTMGIPVNVLEKMRDLKNTAAQVGSKEIEPALKGITATPDITPVIASIDAKLKPGITSVIKAGDPLPLGDIEKPLAALRKFLTDDKSVRTDVNQLHQFQSALRAKADDLLNSSSSQERQLGYALMDVRNQIVQAIDNVSPKIKNAKGEEIGSYRAALSRYRDEKQVEDAFIKGASITRNRPGQWDDRPEFWKEWIDNASDQQIAAAKEGARIAVDQQINGMRHAAKKGTDIPEIEFNREKLELLFGKKEVGTMSKKLKDERDIADTNSKLVQNSQTAMRMKADARIDLPTHKDISPVGYAIGAIAEPIAWAAGYPGIGGTIIAGNMARDIAHRIKVHTAKKKNERITDLLSATGSDRDAVIKILENALPKPKQSLLQKGQQFALPVLPP